MTLAKAIIVNYYRNSSFIVLATVITIVNYDRKTFIVQAPGVMVILCFSPDRMDGAPICNILSKNDLLLLYSSVLRERRVVVISYSLRYTKAWRRDI